MFKSIAVIALATAALVSAQDLTVSTPPSLVQCQPVIVNWAGGVAPYILDVIPGGQTGAAALENLQNAATGTSYSWTVNLAAGTSVTLKVTDSKGMINYSSPLTIQTGSSDSCLSASATSAAGSAGVTGQSVSSGASGASSAASSASMTQSSAAATSMSRTSMMMSSSASMTSGSMTSSSMMSNTASSAAATTSGAAHKKYEVPAAILAAVGGVAALL